MTDPTSLSAAAIAELRAGRKLSAVRIVRGETGLGLQDSLAVVEQYLAGDATLRQLIAAHDRNTRQRGLRVLVVAAALVLLAAFLVFSS